MHTPGAQGAPGRGFDPSFLLLISLFGPSPLQLGPRNSLVFLQRSEPQEPGRVGREGAPNPGPGGKAE